MTASTAPAKSRNVQYTVTTTATVVHTAYINVPRETTPDQLQKALEDYGVDPVYTEGTEHQLADDLSKVGIDGVVESINFDDVSDYTFSVDPDAEDVDDED